MTHSSNSTLAKTVCTFGACCLGILGAGLIAGCSAATDTGSEPAQEASIEAQQQLLNSLEVGGERIDFVAYEAGDGSPRAIFIEGTLSNRQESVFTALERQEGKLTALEKFYALAPTGAAPHEFLVESHAAQAVRIERADASVKRVTFDPSSVEKFSTPTACRNAVLAGATATDSFTSAWFETAGTVCTDNCDWTSYDMKTWACVADGSVGLAYNEWRDYEHTNWKSSGQTYIPESSVRYWSWDGSIVPLKMMRVKVLGMNNNPHSIGWAIGFF